MKNLLNIRLFWLIAILFVSLKNQSFAQTLQPSFNKNFMLASAEQLTKTYAKQLFPTIGKDFTVAIKSFNFDPAQGKFLVDVETKWSGRKTIFEGRSNFQVDGVLSVYPNGGGATFSPTWESPSVVALKGFINVIKVIVKRT